MVVAGGKITQHIKVRSAQKKTKTKIHAQGCQGCVTRKDFILLLNYWSLLSSLTFVIDHDLKSVYYFTTHLNDPNI